MLGWSFTDSSLLAQNLNLTDGKYTKTVCARQDLKFLTYAGILITFLLYRKEIIKMQLMN